MILTACTKINIVPFNTNKKNFQPTNQPTNHQSMNRAMYARQDENPEALLRNINAQIKRFAKNNKKNFQPTNLLSMNRAMYARQDENPEALLRNINAQIKRFAKNNKKNFQPTNQPPVNESGYVRPTGLEPRSTASEYQRSDQKIRKK